MLAPTFVERTISFALGLSTKVAGIISKVFRSPTNVGTKKSFVLGLPTNVESNKSIDLVVATKVEGGITKVLALPKKSEETFPLVRRSPISYKELILTLLAR